MISRPLPTYPYNVAGPARHAALPFATVLFYDILKAKNVRALRTRHTPSFLFTSPRSLTPYFPFTSPFTCTHTFDRLHPFWDTSIRLHDRVRGRVSFTSLSSPFVSSCSRVFVSLSRRFLAARPHPLHPSLPIPHSHFIRTSIAFHSHSHPPSSPSSTFFPSPSTYAYAYAIATPIARYTHTQFTFQPSNPTFPSNQASHSTL